MDSTRSGAAKGSGAKDSDAQSTHSSECSICLCPVAPCQALFVAPCSHVWHYKCIREIIYPSWPSFQCPNCRAYADLEADVDPPEEDEDDEDDDDLDDAIKKSQNEANNSSATETSAAAQGEDGDLTAMMNSVSVQGTESSASGSDHEAEVRHTSTATSNPVTIGASAAAPVNSTLPESIMARSATPTSTAQFALAAGVLNDGGPTTPMNDVGPFLFETTSAPRSRGSGNAAQ